VKSLLLPFSAVYGCATALRNRAFDLGIFSSYRSKLPTISVGNLSVGGNAKTPLVLWLAERLKAEGERPFVLSRGYGGNSHGPLLVTAEHTASEVGDEPLLMRKQFGVEVIICRSRVAGAKYAEERTDATVLLLDDGMQHRWLHRDLEILTIDVSTPAAIEAFQSGQLLPMGKFRECKQRGLRRVDVVVAALRRPIAAEVDKHVVSQLGLPEAAATFVSEVISKQVVDWFAKSELLPQEVVAWCGIANPDGFLSTLHAAGYKVVGSLCASDHQKVSVEALKKLSQKFPGVPLVCTEKDFIKYKSIDIPNCFVCKVQYCVSDERHFASMVMEVLLKVRNGRDK
jgi:tetraacyldisaccharide 4'-kinase